MDRSRTAVTSGAEGLTGFGLKTPQPGRAGRVLAGLLVLAGGLAAGHGALAAAPAVAASVPAAAPAAHSSPPRHPAHVTQQRLENADREAGNWMAPGRTWSEQRFSPLSKINDRNVSRLGLAWYAELDTFRGVESSPLVIDGVLYNISAWDITSAYDAVSGKLLWRFDPKIPVDYARRACCGPVSKGIAAWEGHIILGTLDGRLISLDAATGKPVWSVQTFEPSALPLTITGAPRIAEGLVLIGNAGGDLGGRGYISAYRADTGAFVWRFYIVPGDPAKMPEGAASDSIMPMAAKTWTGEWWKYGGGGNDWDTIVYDPQLHMVYFGTGNGSPGQPAFRSPEGGDNLFLASIVAVNVADGHYVWHYQEVPGESWDYDSTNPLMLADLTIDGQPRQVIMHAPKDGFFYVLDRRTGQLISARNYVPNAWASGIDLTTGKPQIYPGARATVAPVLMTPGTGGGHNWNPMSFSPLTGLVYIPAQVQWWVQSRLPDGEFKFTSGQSAFGAGFRNFPELRKQLNALADEGDRGFMLAWDPVKQKEAFRIPYPHPGNGGTLATAGNLLVQGTINRTLAIYRADDGEKLWEMPTGSVPVSGPIAYEVHGRQYLAVNAGWNSAIIHQLDKPEPFTVGSARLLVFALDAKGVKLPPTPPATQIPPPPTETQPRALVDAGAELYSQHCSTCHGANAAGGAKDLRHLAPETHEHFLSIVRGGERKEKGMPNFQDLITEDQAKAIHAYVINRAQEDWQPSFYTPAPRQH